MTQKNIRLALAALHFAFMNGALYYAFRTGNTLAGLGFAAVFFFIVAGLATGKRKVLTIACCALVLLLAGYYLLLLGVFSLMPLPAPVLRPLVVALALQVLVEIASIIFVIRAPGKGIAAG
jgi:hypothetical protein